MAQATFDQGWCAGLLFREWSSPQSLDRIALGADEDRDSLPDPRGSNVARSRKSDRPALLLLQLQATSLGGRQPGTSQVPENQDYGREYQSAALAILSTETGSVPGAQIPPDTILLGNWRDRG